MICVSSDENDVRTYETNTNTHVDKCIELHNVLMLVFWMWVGVSVHIQKSVRLLIQIFAS